jgi:indolepyruvate ferredoxin oxidoreductase
MTDARFLKDDGAAAFTGNELILKGALEGGAALLTGYPGSPVSEVFEAVGRAADLLKEKGIVARMANNEALAAARLNGARLAGLRGLAVMKSVGLHVAADGLAIGNLAESRRPEGGAVVVVGDDPWNETTQINSDSRFLSQHLHMPVVEPSSFQELKDWIGEAFALSGESDLYVTYVITTNQADGGAVVACRPNRYPDVNARHKATMSSSAMPVQDLVMIPPHTSLREATLPERQRRFLEGARRRGLNRIIPGTDRAAGFMAAGMPYAYLVEALRDMGLEGRYPILKWGVTYPLDESLVREFARTVDRIFVIEEKRGFVETATAALLHRAEQNKTQTPVEIWGKVFPAGLPGVPEERGLNASVLIDRLAPLFEEKILPGDSSALREALARVRGTSQVALRIPARTPTFCPGCPHRDSSSVSQGIKRDFADAAYMKRVHDRDAVDVIFHGESGCHSMLQFEPNVGLMQDYSGMGLGGGTGAGMDPFITNKQVVFLGDSTFFHSGMVAVSDAVKNAQDITFIILDNKTTAMTGHQPTPGGNKDVMFETTFAQDIEQVIRGFGRDAVPLFRVNPAYRDPYRTLLEEVILQDGVKVVIADKECGITYHRRLRRERKELVKAKGFLPVEKFINITPEVCEYCLECTRSTGCPGLTVEETLHGPKIVTDLSLCVTDGACAKGNVCPSFEEVVVHRRAAAPSPAPTAVPEPPDPARRSLEGTWYAYTAGVGGMGSGVVTAVLVEAGRREGYHVSFADKKGLAIRNGGVFGHVVYALDDKPRSPLVPYGRADLLIGIDILEAARGLDPQLNLRVASADRTVAVLNTHKTPTVGVLLGKEDFSTAELVELFKKHTRPVGMVAEDFSRLSEALFGHRLYANAMLLGAAFQRGLLPLSQASIAQAMRVSLPPADVAENLAAFDWGRKVVASPEAFEKFALHPPTARAVVEDRASLLDRGWGGRRRSVIYRRLMDEAGRWLDVTEPLRAKLAQAVYDLIRYQGPDLARRYLKRLDTVHRRDRKDKGFAATAAALEFLPRAMIIKDEVYVAGLLTAPEKYRRDRERFRIDPKRGDRVEYRHLNRPRFTILGRDIEFAWSSRDWQLRIMRHCGFLRRFLPQWHAKEKAFREWYESVVDGFNFFAEDSVYQDYVEVLKTPDAARGYREVRYSRQDEAQKRAQALLDTIHSRTRGAAPSRSAV